MFVSCKRIVIIPVSLSLALLVASCDDSKVSQCQRLVLAVNEGSALVDKNKGSQVSTSLQLAKDLEKVTKDIKELSLKDPQLQDFQSAFVKYFDSLSQNISKAGRALGSAKTAEASPTGRLAIQKARGEIDSSLTAATKSAKESDALIKNMNEYCSQAEK
jgi:hypothetical protein